MFSDPPASNGSGRLLADELRWVIHIRRSLEADDEEDGEAPPVSIFRVPSTMLAGNSSCYVPQVVGLGPYHRWRPELRQMDSWKLSAARRAGRRLLAGGLRFHHIAEHLGTLEHRLRASYHGHLDCNGETLAWAMAIDGCFLLELLRLVVASRGGATSSTAGFAVKRCTRDMLLRDLVMLENQVPLWVLLEVLEEDQPSAAESLLAEMVAALVQELSPFNLTAAGFVIPKGSSSSSHLLEGLYDAIVPKPERSPGPPEISPAGSADQAEELSSWLGHAGKVASCLRRAAASRPVKLLLEIPCRAIANLPAIAPLMLLAEHLLSDPQNGGVIDNAEADRLAAEEIAIPSATELAGAGVRFSPAGGGPTKVAFDGETGTLRLPTVDLDANTEATLRNLVAYEATSPAAGPAFMARYVELMNGIIDAAEDVRQLREAGVVKNYLKSDGDAAALWNGMSRSVQQLTRVPSLDEAIKDVNRYYHRQWRVKLSKLLRQSRRSRFALPAAAVVFFLFFFTGFNAVCLLGRCER